MQRLFFLQRDWENNNTYSWGVGQEYIESKLAETGSNNGDITAVRKEIKNAFKNVGCCLLPVPGDLVNGQDDPPCKWYELCFKGEHKQRFVMDSQLLEKTIINCFTTIYVAEIL
ncbi:unnamed protein product [Clavelina lepadiformis]|uniref:Guanylate-binding protein N-terminal domain-containing protein n=1 Tax=Clavelina lepadiformis TaxID=159417 RepID=A0ABP0GQF6_CLALP